MYIVNNCVRKAKSSTINGPFGRNFFQPIWGKVNSNNSTVSVDKEPWYPQHLSHSEADFHGPSLINMADFRLGLGFFLLRIDMGHYWL